MNWRVVLVLLLPALGACAAPGGFEATEPAGEGSRPTASTRPLGTVPPDGGAPPVIGEVPEQLMGEILADAARRTGADPDAIDVIRAESRTWNDGSLGCPQPGMTYTQALVDGYHVVVEAAGEQLDYRATTMESFALCEDGGRPTG